MSKYGDIVYVSGEGIERKVDEMPDGYLHNAARKLEARLAGPESENLALNERTRNEAVLGAMKAEMAERASRGPQDEGFA